MRPTNAVDWFWEISSSGPVKVSTADSGPSSVTTSVITRVIVAGSTTSPRIDIIAIRAGKIERTA